MLQKLLQDPFSDDLKKFLETGELGQLTDTPTINEVYRTLGKPFLSDQDTNAVPDSILTRLYYGDVEVRFIDGVFFQLAIYFRENKVQNSESLSPASRISWYESLKKITFPEFKQYCQSKYIKCRQVIFPDIEADLGFAIEIEKTGIWVNFDSAPTYSIDSIHHTPSCPGNFEYIPI